MPAIAIVRAPVAPLHAEPRIASGQVSQALFGHALLVLGEAGDWRRVRTLNDGYEGWAHVGYLVIDDAEGVPEDAPAFRPYEARTFAQRRDAAEDAALVGDAAPALSLGCTVRAGERTLRLPFGAVVFGAQTRLDGETVPLAERAARFPRDGGAIAESAWRFEGTAYQWGGLTPWGADCSGFVQAVCGLHGIELPRDAWQQALVGEHRDRLDGLAAGDLLFFSDREDRRVTHVGLAIDELRMAHLALGRGGWSVEDLIDDDDPYVERLRANFLHARRVV